jgi:hypothetical protein
VEDGRSATALARVRVEAGAARGVAIGVAALGDTEKPAEAGSGRRAAAVAMVADLNVAMVADLNALTGKPLLPGLGG